MKREPIDLLKFIAQTILNKKGTKIIALDVRHISNMTDFILIAEGNIDRHVKAIASEVEKALKELGETPVHVEGRQNGDWMVLDYSDLVIHLFMPHLREKYQLERLWSEGEIVELDLDFSSPPSKKAQT